MADETRGKPPAPPGRPLLRLPPQRPPRQAPRSASPAVEGPLQRPLARPRDMVAREQAQRATAAERGDERVLAGLSRLRSEAAYEAAAACPACAEARAEADDAEALCDAHLEHAMGLHSTWDAIRRR